jgi:hypothetical protein
MELFPTILSHANLVTAAYKWVLKNGACGVAFREFRTNCCNGEHPDVIGFNSGGSVLIECKASRADFFADRNKSFRQTPALGMGDIRYYCCPKGLLKKEELPEGWGLLEVDNTGKAKASRPLVRLLNDYGNEYTTDYRHEKNLKAEHELMYSALRRLHLRGRIEEVYSDPSETRTIE